MLRFIFRITLLLLLFWGFFLGYKYFTDKALSGDINIQYENLLEAALKRNTETLNSGKVIFSQEDIFGVFRSGSTGGDSYFKESEFNTKQDVLQGKGESYVNYKEIPSFPKGNLGLLSLAGDANSNSQFGFSTNSLQTSGDSLGGSNGTCRGIIFDPCIYIGDPSNLKFDGKMYLGKTPIHRYPKEVPESIF